MITFATFIGGLSVGMILGAIAGIWEKDRLDRALRKIVTREQYIEIHKIEREL